MPNLTNKKVSEIHKSVLNIAGSNSGITSAERNICDGNGYDTGISLSNSKVSINSRRGYLDNFVHNGCSSSLIKRDLSFPNSTSPNLMNIADWQFTIDLDYYSGARIHLVDDSFSLKLAVNSKYFNDNLDGTSKLKGYWLRRYGGVKYYLVDGSKVNPITYLDENVYSLSPDPNEVGSDGRIRYNSGLILTQQNTFEGMKHPWSSLSFILIISCKEGVNANIDGSIRKVREFEGSDSGYSSVANILPTDISNYPMYFTNFDRLDITTTPTVYEFKTYNPILYAVGGEGGYPGHPFNDSDDPCFNCGKEILPNVDLRLLSLIQFPYFFVTKLTS